MYYNVYHHDTNINMFTVLWLSILLCPKCTSTSLHHSHYSSYDIGGNLHNVADSDFFFICSMAYRHYTYRLYWLIPYLSVTQDYSFSYLTPLRKIVG